MAAGEPLLAAELAELTELEAEVNIADLPGLEFATGLTRLQLGACVPQRERDHGPVPAVGPDRPGGPQRRRTHPMRTHIHHLTAAAVAALIALATPAAATEYEASDYLPLAVGKLVDSRTWGIRLL